MSCLQNCIPISVCLAKEVDHIQNVHWKWIKCEYCPKERLPIQLMNML